MNTAKIFFLLCAAVIIASVYHTNSNAQTPACDIKKNTKIYSLNKLSCAKEFNYLQGAPLSSKYGQVECVKIVYNINDKQVYYINSKLFQFHYDFCTFALGYTKSLEFFNYDEYGETPNREFLLANLNYYSAANKFIFEFFANDKISTENIILFYEHLKATAYFGDKLYLMVNSNEIMNRLGDLKGKVPLVYPEDVYKFQKYQALNKEETYGYIHKISDYDSEKKSIKVHDIIVVKNVPQDVPLISGIITDQFQTPLSHINILSHNRRTPNASSKGIWNSTLIDTLNGKLVHYIVKDDAQVLKPALPADAEKFWEKKSKSSLLIKLKLNTAVSGLLSMKMLSKKSVDIVGGKAANMGELSKIKVNNTPLPIPEEAFAIPVFYYVQHINKSGIIDSINKIVDNDSIKYNYMLLDKGLKKIREMIKGTPIDTALLGMVERKIRSSRYKTFRFRSSTNSEDIENFNGAGLYDSKSGTLGDSIKTIERAIKQVWASVWNTRAFQEREYFKIDQHTVAMGILVHKAFGTESANGVAVTSNIYRDNYPAFTINVQKGEASVVFPPDSVNCDQIIIGTRHISGSQQPSIDYITRSNLKPYGNVLSEKEIDILVEYLSAIKWHYYKLARAGLKYSYDNFSMDVEFKLDAVTRKIIIKQARPY